ncbi:odorant receptor 131-2-like [Pygocentrus nattereri]|uniref:odorant receptor 131-2-like n=1 Tax=Pygocentrus nattereri TaxID=42514 RepID=UPI0008146076|nr:odorant receptor 131-2-like [Pygocentrus nattereri]
MAGTNESNVNAFLYQNLIKSELDGGNIVKLVVAILTTLFSVYVNCIMLYALMSKRVFKESPRYILFAHMLFNDSVHLILSTMMYVLALAFLKLAKAVCSLIMFISTTTFLNAPLNLAVMSLERYVAIRFPLRHAEIATQKRTYIAICFVWLFGSANILTDIIFAAVMDPNFFYMQMYCFRDQIFIKQWQLDLYNGCNIFYFVSVTVIIIFTYISIMLTARSMSSNKDSAKKAHRTVLLHLIQLGLCLTSFVYGSIERALYLMAGSDTALFKHLRYLNFLIVLIVPRCLSPLIYGLRDDAVRPLFKYYFCYGSTKAGYKRKPVTTSNRK